MNDEGYKTSSRNDVDDLYI